MDSQAGAEKVIPCSGRLGSSINQTSHDWAIQVENVKFKSMPNDIFRASINQSPDGNGVLLWFESKKSKQQWQATIEKVEGFGPTGVPDTAVLSFLKVRLFISK